MNAADEKNSPGAGTPAAEAPVTGGLTYVFYHRDADGFGSALAAWCALGDRDVCYVSVQYDEPAPVVVDGARVYVVDFCFPREVLRGWLAQGCDVVVIDHHQTAIDELTAHPMETPGPGTFLAVFDPTRAGCDLAWEWFGKLVHGEFWRQARPVPRKADGSAWPRTAGLLNEPLPWLLKAVADRDLWQFKYDDTKAICARLDLEKWEFALWFSWCKVRESAPDVAAFIRDGELLMKQQEQIARRQAKEWHWLALRGTDSETEVIVPAVNCVVLRDETAHALLDRTATELKGLWAGNQPVVACYFRTKDGFKVSLRGDGTVDVAAIAQRYKGGGGHKSAAGFLHRCGPVRLTDPAREDGAMMISLERERQVEKEGYDAALDDGYTRGQLADAAIAYLIAGSKQEAERLGIATDCDARKAGLLWWPWLAMEFNPAPAAQRNYEKAGALMAAEWDRLERLKTAAPERRVFTSCENCEAEIFEDDTDFYTTPDDCYLCKQCGAAMEKDAAAAPQPSEGAR